MPAFEFPPGGVGRQTIVTFGNPSHCWKVQSVRKLFNNVSLAIERIEVLFRCFSCRFSAAFTAQLVPTNFLSLAAISILFGFHSSRVPAHHRPLKKIISYINAAFNKSLIVRPIIRPLVRLWGVPILSFLSFYPQFNLNSIQKLPLVFCSPAPPPSAGNFRSKYE